ncbi:MAG TPA: HIT domain-containing protein [Syntrophales bacterium]|nr:HIT domain-containing protein [Syntrophales bacterium]
MQDCIFCKIVRGELPSARVFEDESVFAFDDIHPVAPAHVIIVPKKHFATLMDIGKSDAGISEKIVNAVQQVAKIKAIDKRGFRAVINTGDEGGQVVQHLHVHVFGGRRLKFELE